MINNNHAELRKGEIFLGMFNNTDCKLFKCTSKRTGKFTSSNNDGELCFPLFILKKDYDELGVNIKGRLLLSSGLSLEQAQRVDAMMNFFKNQKDQYEILA